MAADESKIVELNAVIREIQDRVRARYPVAAPGDSPLALADLMPVVHARDRAEAKVASIGSVNPRPPGVLNNLAQSFKRTIARGLAWFVRDQVEFNRGVIDCVNALIEATNETNRALAALAAQSQKQAAETRAEIDRAVLPEIRELKDIRLHWEQWRQEWERKLSINEVQFLRSVADLQSGFQHRASLMEGTFRDIASSQHKDFAVALDKARLEIQERLWQDMRRTREEFEKLIHNELRVVRQRAVAASPVPVATISPGIGFAEPPIDFLRFAERFRGSEDYVQKLQQRYVPHFIGCADVLDLGCGRGEFLACLRDAGVLAKGIDSNPEMVSLCRARSLYAEQADLFDYLGELDEGSLDGIFCGQVVEHMPPARIPELISLAAATIRHGGKIVIETPNPECLAIFASHFYIDPTHQRPVPATLLAFYLEENGFRQISVEYVNPAQESMPAVATLPEEFRKAFFGGLDYAISATRL